MSQQFVHIGFDNMLAISKIVAILKPNSTHVRCIVKEARQKQLIVSTTQGKKVRSVILTSDGYVFLSTLNGRSITDRIDAPKQPKASDEAKDSV
jgi:extracellular matrix regulatory protein A